MKGSCNRTRRRKNELIKPNTNTEDFDIFDIEIENYCIDISQKSNLSEIFAKLKPFKEELLPYDNLNDTKA